MSRILAKDAAKFSYVLPGGEYVPSVTVIINLLAKKGLDWWIWEQGRKGIPMHQAMDKPTSIGRIAHYYIECKHERQTPLFDGFRSTEIEEGKEISDRLDSLLEQHSGTIVGSEVALVDAENKYGGTIDLLIDTPERRELWDIKTAKRLYINHYIQLMAYKQLLLVNNHDDRIPRLVLLTKDGRVHAPDISLAMQEHALQTWQHLLPCYHAYKKLEKEMSV